MVNHIIKTITFIIIYIINLIIYDFISLIKNNNMFILIEYFCNLSFIFLYFIVNNHQKYLINLVNILYSNDITINNETELHLDDIPYINNITMNINNKNEQTIVNAKYLKIELINNIHNDYGYYLLNKFTNAIENFLLDSNINNFKSLDILVSPIIQYIS